MVPVSRERVRSSGLRARSARRWAPPIIVALCFIVGIALGLHEYLSLDAFRRYQDRLSLFVDQNAALAAMGYLAVYVAAVAVSFPGASFLTAAGGFMFGALAGGALAVLAATIGATVIFLIARTSLGDLLTQRAGPRIQKLTAGFQENGFSYLLFLRLAPLFPFWLVNLAAALFGLRLLPYVAATAIGIVPGSFVLAYFGAGLGSVLEGGEPALSPSLFLAFALLGFMALLPALVRIWRRRPMNGENEGR